MLRGQDAGNDPERAVVLSGVDHGVDMRPDQEPRLRAAKTAAHGAKCILAHRQAGRAHPARDQIGGTAVLRREEQPDQPAGLGGNRTKLGNHGLRACAQCARVGRGHDRISTLIVVSSIASALIRMCMTMVSVVEPLAQRNQPG